jgi:5-methyltetrahydrofolate--homocysteine methyltransferase
MSEELGLAEALATCQEARVKQIVEQQLAAQADPADILAECNRGMAQLGQRFADGDCFIPELMMGGMMMKAVSAQLAPLLEKTETGETVGTVVMGSVQHDVHDIGKDIVVMMLRGVGFEVVDLGVDVPPGRFVEAIRQHRPQVLGLSVLLTTCYNSVTNTVAAIREAECRDGLSIMVGGAAASQLLSETAGCDFYGRTAVDGMKHASAVVGIDP